jgi:predicted transcriptional regulator
MSKKEDSPLYRLRQSLGVSVQRLSKELDISYPVLFSIEKGDYRVLPTKFLENLKKTEYPQVELFEEEYQKFIDSQGKLNWKEASI